MKSVYKRTQLTITEFDTDDVILTSGADPVTPPEPTVLKKLERENRYGTFDNFDLKPPTGSWF